MYKRRALFVDVDGVLAEFEEAFYNFVGYGGNSPSVYDMFQTGYWETREDMHSDMGAFIEDEAWENLEILCSETTMAMLHNVGVEVYILTQVSAGADRRAARVRWLSERFGSAFKGCYFTTYKLSKTDFILNFSADPANKDCEVLGLVEDRYAALSEAYDAGIKPYGIRRGTNWTDRCTKYNAQQMEWYGSFDDVAREVVEDVIADNHGS